MYSDPGFYDLKYRIKGVKCQNPIVELKNLEIGDYESALSDIQEMSKEFYGWDELIGKSDLSVFDFLQRGFSFLFELRQKNPCADIYYTWEDSWGEIERFGVKEGKAKYNIKSILNIVNRASVGEKALVRHVVYQRTKLDVPQTKYYKIDETTTREYTEYYDLKEISNKLALVPKKGTVEVVNEIVALKNNSVYDTGGFQIDWVQDPPENEGYFSAAGETLMVGGQIYKGSNDGLITGNFSTGSIAGAPIIFNKGDIGITIRKKETPSSCTLDVDHQTGYPPVFQITVNDIKNLFGEKMPDKVKVAFKAEKGEILNGEEVGGWRVFTSNGGILELPIYYKPPKCGQSDSDNLKVAGVCDFHDGPVSIGKERFKEQIFNPYCHDATARITYTKTKRVNCRRTKDCCSFKETNNEHNVKFVIDLTCEENPRAYYADPGKNIGLDKLSMPKMQVERYNYYIESARLQFSSLNAFGSMHKVNADSVAVDLDIHCNSTEKGTNFEIKPQRKKPSIEIRLDPSTGRIIKVKMPKYGVTGEEYYERHCKGVKRKYVRPDHVLAPYDSRDERSRDIEIGLGLSADRDSCWKVSYDKDGRSLRGECSKVRNREYLTTEEKYRWELYLRKK
jgi:hypothetical protein